MKRNLVDAALFVLASPVLVVRALASACRKYEAFRVAQAEAIPCECGADIMLVGFWRCSCGFTYRGHVFRACPVCGSVPRMVRCTDCGATVLLPEA